MKIVLKIIGMTITIILSFLICGSYYQSWFSPVVARQAVFLGFVFPYLWVAAAFWSLVMLCLRAYKTMLVTVVSLVLTIGGMMSVMNMVPTRGKSNTEGKVLRVMTYNVHGFGGLGYGKKEMCDEVKRLAQDVDVICFQEVPGVKWRQKTIGSANLKELFDMPYEVENIHERDGLRTSITEVILSRYPILSKENNTDEISNNIMETYIDVDGKKIRIIACHLESIRLSSHEIDAVNCAKHIEVDKEVKSDLKTTYRKMKQAYENRSAQVDYLADMISDEDVPTIVCGDFNDTPISYTYHRISSKLDDTFSRSFMKWGDTYNGNLPKLRIDYIFHSKDMMTTKYEVLNQNPYSDHFPVKSDILIK